MLGLAFGGLIAFALAACSPIPREQLDAGQYCGNGVIDPDGETDVLYETCDDGPRNGTADSYCNKYCKDGSREGVFTYGRHAYLGFRPTAVVDVRFDDVGDPGQRYSFAFTSDSYQGIVVVPEMRTALVPIDDTTPIVRTPLVHIPTPAAPVALGVAWLSHFVSVPIWVEAPRDGEPSPRMYYAIVDRELQVEVHEVPYPFPDGTSPTMHVTTYSRHGVLLVDQSSTPPHDLLVAVVVVRSPTDVTTSTLRVPAPGRVRGAAVETTAIEEYGNRFTQRVVQFFDDTRTFVAVVTPQPDVPVSEATTYELTEFARGRWPSRVVAGIQWSEGCDPRGVDLASFNPVLFPEFSTPVPLAILTDTGDVFTWRFTGGVEGEPFLTPFARVAAGTQVIESNEYPSLFAWEPDGTLVALPDSDCRDLRSTALHPRRYPSFGPWTTMMRPTTPPHFNYEYVVDDWLVLRP